MNGGMFDRLGEPIGLYVEAGQQIHPLNRKHGTGNFHLLPNGVFSVEADGWHVRISDDYFKAVTTPPAFASQSGPMMLIDGKLNANIAENGSSLYVRNAVGIDRNHRAHFVISAEPVSFGKLARLFRDRLDCTNALYLDGFVSSLWDPSVHRLDDTAALGPLIVVEKSERRLKP